MSTAIVDALKQSAIRTGSNIVKDIISAQLGPTIGGLAGSVIDGVAGQLGVAPDEIPSCPPGDIDQAVTTTNNDPEILALYVEAHRITADLFKAEMAKGGEAWWTWAWRPFWMWLLAFFWFWNGILVPTLNGVLASNVIQMPWEPLGAITATYTAMYLGGHTFKNFAQQKWGGR
ncbi:MULTISPECIES: hypothetical protein [unclassified Brucella]|uniref:hypothetical protein n=1 Tax=unclassified Brucella TaxID=2632610 RepID=UPI0012AE1B36|nr:MULTISPECIES: hypothetical protein [unclassified Brucella]MRN43479.1 hypothetical protein [Brucella sp. 09RB8913]MRN48217.1 hypothetical protein [Brucella sp. 10RB9212]MRN59393.1 hypothetical protein [Brucella sp. 09RB8918]MRN67951.1 hypothetical protein [Brucella sp. 10RB9213]